MKKDWAAEGLLHSLGEINGEQAKRSLQLLPFDSAPHPLCLHACSEVQSYLNSQEQWNSSFGLGEENDESVRAKMFGVLIVAQEDGELAYLAAYSGKLLGSNHQKGFVPPVYDSLAEDGFLAPGMRHLKAYSDRIAQIEKAKNKADEPRLEALREKRRSLSQSLQEALFKSYVFLNKSGHSKGLVDIFKDALDQAPPSAAGECGAPKLLQYAFGHKLKPLAIAEFWWGKSERSPSFSHAEFYPACEEKCRPILEYMLASAP